MDGVVRGQEDPGVSVGGDVVVGCLHGVGTEFE